MSETKKQKKEGPKKPQSKKRNHTPKPGKRLRASAEMREEAKHYSVDESLAMLKQFKGAKFDESVDVALKLTADPRYSDQVVRGSVLLPEGLGKKVRVAVFAKGEKVKEAEEAGADFVGGDELLEKIQKEGCQFDRCIATPDMMAKVGKIGKILGPKGLMPNPKLGTVTFDVAEAVKAAKKGQVEFRAEKGGIVHCTIGRVSFSAQALKANLSSLIEAVKSAKPSGVKGAYMKRLFLSTTMGPSVRIDLTNV